MPSLLLNFLPAVILRPLKALIAWEYRGFGLNYPNIARSKRRLNQRPPGLGYLLRLGRAVLILALVGALIAPSVQAEEAAAAAEASPPTPTQLNSTDIPADQVNQFVDAYLEVVTLVDGRSEDLKRATTEAESLQIQQAIQTEAYELIEAAGLTRQTYWQLLELANSDPEFRDRILAQLEEKG